MNELFNYFIITRITVDSDDDDKRQRVVLPEKAKRLEEINGLVKQLKNAKKIKDVVKANQSEYNLDCRIHIYENMAWFLISIRGNGQGV